MNKTISLRLISATLIAMLLSSNMVFANPTAILGDDGDVTVTYQYETSDNAQQYEFAATYEYQGVNYELQSQSAIVIDTVPDVTLETLTVTEELENLKEKNVDTTYTYETGEQTFTLHLVDVEYENTLSETEFQTVEHTESLGFGLSAPDAPNTATVSYQDTEGNTQTTTASLIEVVQTTSSWQDGYTINAKYYGDEDVKFYQFGNVQIPNTGSRPVYEGYEDTILSSLGLSSSDTRINSASWGSVTSENGTRVQNAVFNISRYGSNYSAVYRVAVPTIIYAATAVYELKNAEVLTGTTTYTKEATAIYSLPEPTGLSTLAKIGIVLGTLVLAVFIVLLLYIIAKKKKQKANNQSQ